ncbi:MAG: prepilin-type N-terminal cleavage/methylation domain-containing protein [Candidatus Gastranaerophilales bacterium]|nr:prepilin-type N-terminal cleavage/methylation domain-containing protein [Candidatus Gastranaerophilales bacterium]
MIVTLKGFHKLSVLFNPEKRKVFGFTLAEVLITLGIIGIVAAMTIPGLLAKIREQHYKVAYKKTYSSLNQAMKFIENEDITFDLKTGGGYGSNEDNKGVYYNSKIGEIFKYIATYYYKSPTTCFENNADKCWVCERGEAGSISGSGAPNWLGCTKSSYAFIDINGIAYYLYSNSEYPILIDINGNRKPNQLGRDRFVLYFANSFEQSNKYPDSVNAVLPKEDEVKKGRWCPQGNCLYKSWIRR